MDARQNNKMSMYIATMRVLRSQEATLNTVPALADGITQFDALVQAIDAAHRIQMTYSSANSKMKIKEEDEMIQATVQVAAALYVYAHDNKLPGLKSQVGITPSSLKRMTDKELKNACQLVLELAETYVGDLADYGVTPEVVATLKKEIEDYATLIATPRNEIVTRSQATARLKELFDEADELLKNKLDKLMVLMEVQQPAIYKTYLAARVIVDLKSSKTTEEETATTEA
ncbi:hypothetical protein KDU71_10705 [Carboxylicivirga sediminis]|uniref:Uncharacterized protein n=1 Tax=Carboxylicivirga sediminis TaxID=2006564 RepID=A0A941F4X8_9BACT|nr:hypothetical protein [Carboxylicivirga sediminis]MBR8536029.1 hypothetical protein [Carboxylicivirga sediminis]